MILCGIWCDSENRLVLTSKSELQAWQAIEELLPVLWEETDARIALFSWKKVKESLITARETYAWRKAIDLIKESNLEEKCNSVAIEAHVLPLMKSKPIMLRMAGEITNSLIHSYDRRHRISFFQKTSTEPS